MSENDNQFLEYLCSDFSKEWNFGKYKREVLGSDDPSPETKASRDHLCKLRKMMSEEPLDFMKLCNMHGLKPEVQTPCSNKKFLSDCYDKYFCQFTMDSNPDKSANLEVYAASNGHEFRARYTKFVPTSLDDRLEMCSLLHQGMSGNQNYVVQNVRKQQEALNAKMSREAFVEDISLFVLDEQCLANFVDMDRNPSGYFRDINKDGCAVITFLAMKTDHVLQKLTSPTKALFACSEVTSVPAKLQVPTKSLHIESPSLASTSSTSTSTGGTPNTPSYFQRFSGIPPMSKQEPATMSANDERINGLEAQMQSLVGMVQELTVALKK